MVCWSNAGAVKWVDYVAQTILLPGGRRSTYPVAYSLGADWIESDYVAGVMLSSFVSSVTFGTINAMATPS